MPTPTQVASLGRFWLLLTTLLALIGCCWVDRIIITAVSRIERHRPPTAPSRLPVLEDASDGTTSDLATYSGAPLSVRLRGKEEERGGKRGAMGACGWLQAV